MILNSESGSDKRWSSLEGKGEVDGENSSLGGSPKQCRIKTTWALAHLRN